VCGLRTRYSTDLSDAEWEILLPLVPAVRPGGRPAKHTRREILNALAVRPHTLVPAVTGLPTRDVPPLPTRRAAVGWMDTERLNLHAAVDYAACHDRPGPAIAIAVATHGFLRTQGHWGQAIALHRTALNAAHHTNDQLAEARALCYMGLLQSLTGDYEAATTNLTRALRLCLDLGDHDGESRALNYLGRVQQATGDYRAAATNLTRALQLSRDIGDQNGEAESLNGMGELSSACSRSAEACTSYEQALAIARDIGAPAEEARALEGIGRCQLDDGRPGEGAAQLRQALAIYQRLGSPHAQWVETTLRDHGL